MPFGQVYRYTKRGEGGIPSYTFEDITSGIGYDVAQGIVCNPSTGNQYMLNRNGVDIGAGHSENIASNQSKTFNFDPVLFPKTINGNILVGFTWSNNHTGTNTDTDQIQVDVMLNGVSLGYALTSVISANANNEYAVNTYLLPINVVDVHLKKGDVLGIKFTDIQTNSFVLSQIYCDPLNRNGSFSAGGNQTVTAANNHTTLQVYVPFKIIL